MPAAASDQTHLGDLQPDASCTNRSNWCTSVSSAPSAEAGVEAVERSLSTGGWSLQCRHPRLRVFRKECGHEIAWVLPSGRVQIRVPLLVESAARERSAVAVYRELREALAG